MGAREKLKARRRTMRRQETAALRATHAQMAADPEYQTEIAALNADGELQTLIARDIPLQVARLHAAGWRCRLEGNDGAGLWDCRRGLRVIHSLQRNEADIWAHVSVSSHEGTLPGWYEVRNAQWVFYPDRPGIVIIAPRAEHVNMAEVAHVWTCLTRPSAPDFRFRDQILVLRERRMTMADVVKTRIPADHELRVEFLVRVPRQGTTPGATVYFRWEDEALRKLLADALSRGLVNPYGVEDLRITAVPVT